MRYFNVAGPCYKADHYMIEASSRLSGVEQLIDMKQYFVIHAARQSGKTTYLKDLARRLREGGKYYVLYCSLEGMDKISDPEIGIPEVVRMLQSLLKRSIIPQGEKFAENANFENFTNVLNCELSLFCSKLDKPLVVLFDEIDCLTEGTLISFLRQLRNGFIDRDTYPFVHSIALVGMRNVRDYKAKIRPDSQTLGSASPFNIVAKTYTLTNFTKEEIAVLFKQHSDETGQSFEIDAIDMLFEQTQGQPWLVNAVAREVVIELLQFNYTQPVTLLLVNQAIQNIILRRDTHIDSLLERLKEERVRRVIEPMLSGEDFFNRLSDDYQYVCDLGLIKEVSNTIQPANPIYAEVIARTLSYEAQKRFMTEKPESLLPHYFSDGQINMNYLFKEFQQFWRENSEIWMDMFQYKEAAPHLILQAFLQRIINGGGEIIREMGAGTGRTDLCVVYHGFKYPIELKIWRGDKTVTEGITQTIRYMERFGCATGWLVVFDQRKGVSWDEKIYIREERVGGKMVVVVGV